MWARDGIAGEAIVNIPAGNMEKIRSISIQGNRSRQLVLES